MKPKDQVVSLKLAKKLKELGVKQESLLWWNYDGKLRVSSSGGYKKFRLPENTKLEVDVCYSAFTVAELGEMLGTELTDANESDSFTLKCGNAIDFWWATFGNSEADIIPQFENIKFADALAETLIYLIENKLFTI